MNKQNTIVLNGENLKIEDISALVSNPEIRVSVSASALNSINKSRDFLEKEASKRIVYGVNTGFGPMASYIINNREVVNLQENLIRSHAVGMGSPIKWEYSLAAMVVRLNTLIRGYSGVSETLIHQLETFINFRIVPLIPEHGAVGTSGDLVQLAHIALSLIGEGDVFYKGKTIKTKKVLKKLKIKPYKLKSKEGLALINGTSTMSAIAALVYSDAEKILNKAIQNGAFSIELIRGFNDSTSEKLHSLRPHRGQVAVAKILRQILSSSHLRRNRFHFSRQNGVEEEILNQDVHQISESVQEIYSFRCIPQILGPVFEACENMKRIVEIEINSVTDNPIVDWENNTFIHGGNFHGDYIASTIDQLKAALIKLTMLSERRINFFLNRNLNKYFPPFLNLRKPGLDLGLQGLQFVATSTTAVSQSLAYPHHIHSIPTNGDNQDVVSMGTDAALLAAKVIDNAYIVIAIELIVLAQATEFLDIKNKLSNSSEGLLREIRKIFPKIDRDRVIIYELEKVIQFLK